MKHLLTLTTALSALTLVPQLAHADNSFTLNRPARDTFVLHLELGATSPLTQPQSYLYQPGPSLAAKGMFALTPYVAVGPVVSAVYLPRFTDNGQNAGVLLQAGGSVRVQGNRTTDNWSPWVDLDLTAAYTGNLWRPSFDVGAGFDVALDTAHEAWVGPFVRFNHVFQSADMEGLSLLDPHDVNLIQAGLAVSFDFPPHRSYSRVVVKHDVKVVDHVVLVAAPEQPFQLVQHVYFDWDKSVLRWESRDKLDEVVSKLQARSDVNIHVQGHASSDGKKNHNEKLAAARAESVRQYLVSHGVDASRLTVDNFGIDRPAADNKQQEGRERNRRVEFEVIFSSVQK